MAGLGIMFLIPFCASTLGPVMRETSTPPPGLMARPLDPGNWQLQLPLQSPLVTLIWFAPSGTGRHHTLPVCLSYRGRKLVPDPGAKCLYHDNELWLTEAFLMPDGELCDYPAYLRRTLVPFSSPGVHLIASAPRGEIDPARFESTARRLFEQVAALANEARSGSQALPAR
jgi:hypothetical protein